MPTPLPVCRRFSLTERERLLAAFHRSALTQRQFAAQAGLGLSRLQGWLYKAKRGKPSQLQRLIEMPQALRPADSAPVAGSYKLHWPSGLSLEVPRGFTPQELAWLCDLLRRQ